mmetsp:Transcript_31474/g.60611  ORF Transcript_31474/g.60611 Transcript_31474/m.60611 type:complete len:197 (-) Transcript_31474:466-1056(-)
MKLAILSAIFGSAAAFAPSQQGRASTSINSLNGWVPDESAFAWGLPGSLAPVGNFDPLGLSTGVDLGTMKKWREAEAQHVSGFMSCCPDLEMSSAHFEHAPHNLNTLFARFHDASNPLKRTITDETTTQNTIQLSRAASQCSPPSECSSRKSPSNITLSLRPTTRTSDPPFATWTKSAPCLPSSSKFLSSSSEDWS